MPPFPLLKAGKKYCKGKEKTIDSAPKACKLSLIRNTVVHYPLPYCNHCNHRKTSPYLHIDG